MPVNDTNCTWFKPLETVVAWLCDEFLPLSDVSAVPLSGLEAHIGHGVFYPVGGAMALADSLRCTIEHAGGVVCDDVSIHSIAIKHHHQSDHDVKDIDNKCALDATAATAIAATATAAVGVNVTTKSSDGIISTQLISSHHSVISCAGIIRTYLHLLPTTSVDDGVLSTLTGLQETRPKVRVLFWCNGTTESLSLSSSDYVETMEDTVSHANRLVKVWSPSAKDPSWETRWSYILLFLIECKHSLQLILVFSACIVIVCLLHL